MQTKLIAKLVLHGGTQKLGRTACYTSGQRYDGTIINTLRSQKWILGLANVSKLQPMCGFWQSLKCKIWGKGTIKSDWAPWKCVQAPRISVRAPSTGPHQAFRRLWYRTVGPPSISMSSSRRRENGFSPSAVVRPTGRRVTDVEHVAVAASSPAVCLMEFRCRC